MDPAERRAQYACDITYGTNNEFGFDYLRDNMAWAADDLVQRGHNFAIVDEVDSILIDEARTPLIISGPADRATNAGTSSSPRSSSGCRRDRDYEVDEKKRTVGVLEAGIERVEDYLGIDNLYESVNTPLVGFLNNAVRAKELFKRDKDYVVMNGEVLIVDEHTGRLLAGRRYNEGMHQAIEAKEGVRDQRPRTRPWPRSPCRTSSGTVRQARRHDRYGDAGGPELYQTSTSSVSCPFRPPAVIRAGPPTGLPHGGGQVRAIVDDIAASATGRPAGARRSVERRKCWAA